MHDNSISKKVGEHRFMQNYMQKVDDWILILISSSRAETIYLNPFSERNHQNITHFDHMLMTWR